MKKKPKSIKYSFKYRKLYLNDLRDIINIFNKKLIKFSISDDSNDYDNFDEYLEINKKFKKIKKLYIQGIKKIDTPSDYNENKTEIEFNLELNRFNGAIITTENDDLVKEIKILVADILNRNRMIFYTVLSWVLGFIGVILLSGFLIISLMALLSIMGIEYIGELLKEWTLEYGDVFKIYIIFGLFSLYTIWYPNKLKVYLFEKHERFTYLKQNKWKIVGEILKYLTPIITLLIGKYLL